MSETQEAVVRGLALSFNELGCVKVERVRTQGGVVSLLLRRLSVEGWLRVVYHYLRLLDVHRQAYAWESFIGDVNFLVEDPETKEMRLARAPVVRFMPGGEQDLLEEVEQFRSLLLRASVLAESAENAEAAPGRRRGSAPVSDGRASKFVIEEIPVRLPWRNKTFQQKLDRRTDVIFGKNGTGEGGGSAASSFRSKAVTSEDLSVGDGVMGAVNEVGVIAGG